MITDEQQANLRKLATYLTSGELKADFKMNRFSHYDDKWEVDCGTVGCAVGHGPYAGILKIAGEEWSAYSYRVFHDPRTGGWGHYNYMFGADWLDLEPRPDQAAARIRKILGEFAWQRFKKSSTI